MNFVVGADAGLAGLQRVREAADLQDQEVHSIEDFLAVYHPVGQTLQLPVAHRARQSTGGQGGGQSVWICDGYSRFLDVMDASNNSIRVIYVCNGFWFALQTAQRVLGHS